MRTLLKCNIDIETKIQKTELIHLFLKGQIFLAADTTYLTGNPTFTLPEPEVACQGGADQDHLERRNNKWF